MQVFLSAKNLSFEIFDKKVLENINLSIKKGDRIGLVGKNGEGKSTLLKILGGLVKPSKGDIQFNSTSFYLPQIDFSLFSENCSVNEFISRYGIAWLLVKIALNKWFNIEIPPNQSIKTLSGGEFIKLQLAIAQAKNPKLLLLDEPTNHLDIEGLEVLQRFLNSSSKTYVIVSHDPFFLDMVVDRIWELNGGKLYKYGGNYSFYKQQKELERLARERDYKAVKKELERAKQSLERERKRAARSKREGRKQAHDRSMSAMERGYFKNRASETAGKQESKFDKIIKEKEEKLALLKEKKQRGAHIFFENSIDQGKRLLVKIENGSLSIDNNLLIDDINLKIYYGERLVLVGKNGSGKSTFARVLSGENERIKMNGKFELYNNVNVAYVDQKYNIINPNLSVYENLLHFNPYFSYALARQQLGRFLFSKESDLNKKAGTLSGGEAARLVLAIVTSKPVDLLILDEPTNNLDIETLDIVAEALIDFNGAMIIISHNIYFLSRLKIEKAYIINDKKIKKMMSLPSEKKEFYDEMVKLIKTP
jgi:ATPase subunit of ABC transporter with duplicated ATPase domains